jgi:DNA-binding NarL/FixJ family response regulator
VSKSYDISVVLADFQFLTRKSIASLIEETPGFHLAGQIDKPEVLNEKLHQLKPKLLVLDIFQDDPGFLDDVIQISRHPDMHLLIITNSQHHDTIQALLKAGIKGIVTKNCSETEIINALKAVAIGHRFYCNSILNIVMASDAQAAEDCEPTSLSPRELQVLKLIAHGNTTDKIAKKLHISIHTVNSHRKNILRKLNISSPIHLVAYAVETGLVTIDYNKK